MSGFTSRLLASNSRAEKDMEALALSPSVFAAVQRRALTFSVYPIRVYRGYSIGGKRTQPLDPAEFPWVASLLRLLQAPDPRDQEGLFPANPGETIFSQLVADLLLTGNAFAAVQAAQNGNIVGLYRLHPKLVQLERRNGEEVWIYRPAGQPVTLYPRRTIAHLRLLSWQASGAGEFGTGAGAPLANLVRAETTALAQTASMVDQGGADVLVTAKTPAGAQYLSVKENRETVAREASQALAGEDGRRVFVVSGDLDVKPSGLTPADVRAPELLMAAKASELAALGVVPVAVGSDAGTYATAVQQYRTQAELDEQIASIVEAALLRPLTRHFARQSGQPRTMVRADEYTARFDLSTHPGYGYLRTEQINRMGALVKLGWSPLQAAEAEGLDLPDPEGEPGQAIDPLPDNGPGSPVGDQAGPRLVELFPGRGDTNATLREPEKTGTRDA
jgi:phage portal protein BeeE